MARIATQTLQNDPPAGAPPLGPLAKIVIWILFLLVYGGGMGVWFLGFSFVQSYIDSLRGGSSSAEAMGGLEGFGFEGFPGISLEDAVDKAKAEMDAIAPPDSLPASEPSAGESSGENADADWPSLTVVGVMVGNGPNSVMLGSEIVPVGSSYKGVKVLEVQKGSVKLECEGDVKWILVGDKTR